MSAEEIHPAPSRKAADFDPEMVAAYLASLFPEMTEDFDFVIIIKDSDGRGDGYSNLGNADDIISLIAEATKALAMDATEGGKS